jgi:integrase
MPMNVHPRRNKFQLRVAHKLLPKPFYATFDDEVAAVNYGQQLEALLKRGVVPSELLALEPRSGDDPLLAVVIRGYTEAAAPTDSDLELLGTMMTELAGLRVSGVTFQWADDYVRRLKLQRNVAPSTIRKRIGVLARVLDWHLRRTTPAGQHAPANALRLLPKGYSQFTRDEATAAEAAGLLHKRDLARDVRLGVDAEQLIMAALAGERRPDRERALAHDPAFVMLFQLIVDTGLRLREAYRLRADQIDLARGLVMVEGSKGHRGVIKPRMVPLKPALAKLLKAYCKGRNGLLFPFWNGQPEDLKRTTTRLSVRFSKLFEYAGVDNFTEHDLRHEATCRWVELRHPRTGSWAFGDIEICRIMGWTDTNMMLRYASLRGEDLAARMH